MSDLLHWKLWQGEQRINDFCLNGKAPCTTSHTLTTLPTFATPRTILGEHQLSMFLFRGIDASVMMVMFIIYFLATLPFVAVVVL